MIPLNDTIPSRRLPVVTWLLIIANFAVYAYEVSLGDQAEALILRHSLIPIQFSVEHFHATTLVQFFSPWVTNLFLHADVFHVGFNMLYLWIFGDNVEDILGHWAFAFCYLISGIGASLLHVLVYASSPVPVIGASGAIAGILGVYWVLFPYAKIRTLLPLGFLWKILELPALLFLGIWIVTQIVWGTTALHDGVAAGSVAWWAHVGGFLSGLGCVFLEGRRPFHEARVLYEQSLELGDS